MNHTHFLFPIYRIIYLFLIDVITTLRTVRLKEGIPGWYQGNGVHMIRVFPYAAVQFLAYEYFKKVMKVFNWKKNFTVLLYYICLFAIFQNKTDSWSGSYGSCIYNYLSPLTLWVQTLLRRDELHTTLCDKIRRKKVKDTTRAAKIEEQKNIVNSHVIFVDFILRKMWRDQNCIL